MQWNIFRRYFIDPDYGFGTKNIAFTLAKKNGQSLVPQGLTSNTIIVVALIFTVEGKGKEEKKACYQRESRVNGITLVFPPDTVVASGEIIFT
ncbi:TPA: hypothetical protein ACGJN3_002456 [Klebsiella aerogenes]